MEWSEEVRQALLAPLPETDIEFLPKNVRDGKALALAYMDSRAVMNRLDAVVGPENWSFHYEVVGQDCKHVQAVLTVLGISKADAGEAQREEELLKSSVSDGLKRAAVMFGIGRYLYYLPPVRAEYDEQRRFWKDPGPKLNPQAVERALRSCGYTGAVATQPPRTHAGWQPATRATQPENPTPAPERRPAIVQLDEAGEEDATPAQKTASARKTFETELRLHLGNGWDGPTFRQVLLSLGVPPKADPDKWNHNAWEKMRNALLVHTKMCSGRTTCTLLRDRQQDISLPVAQPTVEPGFKTGFGRD